MSIESNILDIPSNNSGIGLFGNPLLFNPNFQHGMFRGFSHEWEIDNVSNTMLPSALEISNPISVIGQPSSSVEQLVQVNENLNNIEVGNNQSNFQTWFSEFEETKNTERKKVNICIFMIGKYFFIVLKNDINSVQ